MIGAIKTWARRLWAARPRIELQTWFQRPILVIDVGERPQALKPRRLYVTFHAYGPAFGFMLCPCGCGETIHLRFMGDRRPRWSLETHAGRATIFPSVWRQSGCRSHFFVRHGHIDWC